MKNFISPKIVLEIEKEFNCKLNSFIGKLKYRNIVNKFIKKIIKATKRKNKSKLIY